MSKRKREKKVSDRLVHRLEGFYQTAQEKKEELWRRARELPLGGLNRDLLVREARKNLGDFVEMIQSSDIFARAKNTARQTKDQFLSVLSIPSQDEVVRLSRKITSLEQRMNKLTRKAA